MFGGGVFDRRLVGFQEVGLRVCIQAWRVNVSCVFCQVAISAQALWAQLLPVHHILRADLVLHWYMGSYGERCWYHCRLWTCHPFHACGQQFWLKSLGSRSQEYSRSTPSTTRPGPSVILITFRDIWYEQVDVKLAPSNFREELRATASESKKNLLKIDQQSTKNVWKIKE